jgi:hypothetical protein
VIINTNLIEAANRAEATSILIRGGNLVYRPEADVSGEDLVIRRPNGKLLKVQLKGRPMVNWKLYGGNSIWMLFPDPIGDFRGRSWFLIEHDNLFKWFERKHGTTDGWINRSNKQESEWSEKRLSTELRKYLECYMLSLTSAIGSTDALCDINNAVDGDCSARSIRLECHAPRVEV